MNRVRRSKAGGIDYAELDEEVWADGEGPRIDYRWLYQMLLTFGAYASSGCQEVDPESVTVEWIESTGLQEPVVVRGSPEAAEKLGMKLPEGEPLTVERIVEAVGPDKEVPTIDVAGQSEGPNYTLRDWGIYWDRRCNDDMAECGSSDEDDQDEPSPSTSRIHEDADRRLLNVVSLSLAGSELESEVEPPIAVRECDLVKEVWPPDAETSPQVLKYALMSPAGSYTDFHLDFGGSSVWYHVISGKKVFALVPPTERNLQMFAAWATSAKQASVFLGEYLEGMLKLELGPGDTVLLPGGWPHAVATSRDSVVVGGNFLHRYNVRLQCEVWQIEDFLGVKPKFRFPLFKHLMWYTARDIAQFVRELPSCPETLINRQALQISLQNEESNSECGDSVVGSLVAKKLAGIGHGNGKGEREGEVSIKVDGLKIRLRPRQKRGGKLGGSGVAVRGKLRRVHPMLSKWELEGLPLLLCILSHWIVGMTDEQEVPREIGSPQAFLTDVYRTFESAGYAIPADPKFVDLNGTVGKLMTRFKSSRLCSVVDHPKNAADDEDWVLESEVLDGEDMGIQPRKRRKKSNAKKQPKNRERSSYGRTASNC